MKQNNLDKIKEIFRNRWVRYSLLLIAGIFLGWLFFATPHSHDDSQHLSEQTEQEPTIWTCSMHPQIKMDKPGQCPLCGMDLTPLHRSGSGDEAIDDNAIQLSPEAMALANVQTTIVSRQNPIKSLQLYGTIQADERRIESQTAHLTGRIEKLFINFTGESVSKGQTIATIYSPDLLNAQQELIEAKRLEDLHPTLIEAAREKLRLWKLSDDQIMEIERTQVVQPELPIKANTSGIVVEKRVNQGDYVNQGSVLFKVADLSQVWALFDAYEVDLPFLRVGDRVEFTLQSLPNRTFSGQISFIDPLLNKTTRTAKVRVVTSNPGYAMKPEMYTTATIQAPLREYNNQIVVPKSAVLWTGKRSIVYVKQPDIESSAFMLRQIELGPSLGDAYVVSEGLKDGEIIVTNGVFAVDASAQLEGKISMMNNPESSHGDSYQHGAEHSATSEHSTTLQSGEKHSSATSQTGEKHSAVAPQTGEKHSAAATPLSGEVHEEIAGVQGLCGMCKERIETTAKSIKGVSSAHWDAESKALHLNYNKQLTSLDAISRALAAKGHDVGTKYRADDKVYDALPSCCHYRK